MRPAEGAGELIAIASALRAFRLGEERIQRQGRHPRLGRVFERVIDLADRKDAQPRPDGSFEISLTPAADGQVFYFFPAAQARPLMRTALALLLYVAGSATAGAALVRRGERVHAASPWSISQAPGRVAG